MTIPLKIHEIRLAGDDNSDWDELYQDSSAMDRFYLVLGELNQILKIAQTDLNTLHVITMPEGCISSHYYDHSYATYKEYLFMKKNLEALMAKTSNILLIPGTIIYPAIFPHQTGFKNIALILYQNQCFEYQQKVTPFSGRVSEPTAFYQSGRLLLRNFKEIIGSEKHISHFDLEFQSQGFTLYPQICIEHLVDSLQSEASIVPDKSLQVIISGSVKHRNEACRAGLTIHTDTVLQDSSIMYSSRYSIFDLKSIKRHTVTYDWSNYFADVSFCSALTSLFCCHWSRVREYDLPKKIQEAPRKDLSRVLIGFK